MLRDPAFTAVELVSRGRGQGLAVPVVFRLHVCVVRAGRGGGGGRTWIVRQLRWPPGGAGPAFCASARRSRRPARAHTPLPSSHLPASHGHIIAQHPHASSTMPQPTRIRAPPARSAHTSPGHPTHDPPPLACLHHGHGRRPAGAPDPEADCDAGRQRARDQGPGALLQPQVRAHQRGRHHAG